MSGSQRGDLQDLGFDVGLYLVIQRYLGLYGISIWGYVGLHGARGSLSRMIEIAKDPKGILWDPYFEGWLHAFETSRGYLNHRHMSYSLNSLKGLCRGII